MTGKKGAFTPPRHNDDLTILHPAVQFLFEEAEFQRVTMAVIQRGANIGMNATHNWRRNRASPTIRRLEAALNVIGYTLAVVPLPEKDEDNV